MPTAFPELSREFDPALILPINGREYRVEPASAELGLYCRAAFEIVEARHRGRAPRLPGQVPEPPEGLTPEEWVLGDAYQQMVADGVPDPHIRHAVRTAWTWIVTDDEDAAREYWETGWQTSQQEADPEAPGPGNRAHRRSQQAGSSPTTSTGGESTTPNRGSGPGTNSRRGGRRRRRR